MPNDERLRELRRKARSLPTTSGVYVMKDVLGKVIYIGKASNLRRRVGQYLLNSSARRAESPKRAALCESIADFDFVNTRSDAEAVILESSLIKQWKPRYNTLEKDNKNFLLLRVETFSPLPRFTFARHRKDDNSIYFGPYLGVSAIRRALAEIKKQFGILLSDAHPKRLEDGRWRLYDDARSEISKYPNIVSEAEYAERVRAAIDFLGGRNAELQAQAKKKMEATAMEMEYEAAAKYRDLLSAIMQTRRANARGCPHADISRTPEEIATAAAARLKEVLGLENPPFSMECFDISHISGSFAVASMVRFENGEPARQKYRRFKIKSFVGNDDFRAHIEEFARRHAFEDAAVHEQHFVLLHGHKRSGNGAGSDNRVDHVPFAQPNDLARHDIRRDAEEGNFQIGECLIPQILLEDFARLVHSENAVCADGIDVQRGDMRQL